MVKFKKKCSSETIRKVREQKEKKLAQDRGQDWQKEFILLHEKFSLILNICRSSRSSSSPSFQPHPALSAAYELWCFWILNDWTHLIQVINEYKNV